jgi:two-component system response regulator YesN
MDKEVQRACKYIEHNFENPDLSIDSICAALITGKAFLEAVFERELGISVEAFIDQVRINRAKIMLNKKPQITAEELAVCSGFKNTDSFLQTFQNVAGIQFETFQKSFSVKAQS